MKNEKHSDNKTSGKRKHEIRRHAKEDLYEPLPVSLYKRLPWLCALFGLGMAVSGVAGLFEEVTALLPVAISFQPLILGMAGNVGTQSLAVTIRILLTEQLSAKEKMRLVLKEARVGAAVGALLGALSILLVSAYLYLVKSYTAALSFSFAVCTAAALSVSVFLSSISAVSIPLLFKKLGIDPAVASGPFITTINDLVAVLTYYGLAWMMIARLM